VPSDVTRKSVVTHCCPRYLSPAFMEGQTLPLYRHESGSAFTTRLCRDMAPQG